MEHDIQRRQAPAAQEASPGHLAENGLRGAGSPLPPTTRQAMEARFGHDFSQVRVHAGDESDDSARALQARAFTVGSDIAFKASAFAPHTAEGEELLAHELAHVIQQSASGPVSSLQGLEVSDPGDTSEREADSVAREAVAAEAQADVP